MTPLADLLVCLRFFSRLPVPVAHRESTLGAAALAQAAWMVPVAGALIGCFPAAVLLVATTAGVPPLLAAPLALAALLAVTGALHEDGLADCADGFGGGRTPARKLEIMRDSRIGTFGACAIGLSLYIRAAALGLVAARSPWLGAGLLIVAAGVSRSACLLPLWLLPPARPDGLGASAGRPKSAHVAAALGIAVAFGVAVPRGLGAVALAAAAALAVCALARRQIRGHTGDVAGAAQQIAEIVIYLVVASAPSS